MRLDEAVIELESLRAGLRTISNILWLCVKCVREPWDSCLRLICQNSLASFVPGGLKVGNWPTSEHSPLPSFSVLRVKTSWPTQRQQVWVVAFIVSTFVFSPKWLWEKRLWNRISVMEMLKHIYSCNSRTRLAKIPLHTKEPKEPVFWKNVSLPGTQPSYLHNCNIGARDHWTHLCSC